MLCTATDRAGVNSSVGVDEAEKPRLPDHQRHPHAPQSVLGNHAEYVLLRLRFARHRQSKERRLSLYIRCVDIAVRRRCTISTSVVLQFWTR